jgi:hypothetical protein
MLQYEGQGMILNNYHFTEERNRLASYMSLPRSKKGKAIPVTGHGGPLGCEMSRLSHFL